MRHTVHPRLKRCGTDVDDQSPLLVSDIPHSSRRGETRPVEVGNRALNHPQHPFEGAAGNPTWPSTPSRLRTEASCGSVAAAAAAAAAASKRTWRSPGLPRQPIAPVIAVDPLAAARERALVTAVAEHRRHGVSVQVVTDPADEGRDSSSWRGRSASVCRSGPRSGPGGVGRGEAHVDFALPHPAEDVRGSAGG